jgi:D-alanyl-D-alanine carboxypeptidase
MCEKLDVNATSTYVQVSRLASQVQGTSADLVEDDVVSIEDLHYGLMLPSGNDAATVLAENFGVYSYYQSREFLDQYEKGLDMSTRRVKNPVSYFVREMNEQAKKLGLGETTFANPHGLANKLNKSTALDVAKLCAEALKNAQFRKIVNTKMHFCTIQEKDGWTRDVFWENTNRLLYHGFHGIKTGYPRHSATIRPNQ